MNGSSMSEDDNSKQQTINNFTWPNNSFSPITKQSTMTATDEEDSGAAAAHVTDETAAALSASGDRDGDDQQPPQLQQLAASSPTHQRRFSALDMHRAVLNAISGWWRLRCFFLHDVFTILTAL
ncbi:hypothetical protein CHUAL_014202 [Chamberlinius hualienensis]